MSDDVLQFMARNGTMLLGGVTALLMIGVLLAAAVRSPVVRLRVCELGVLATVVWVVLACVPMRRVEWGKREVSVAVAPVVEDGADLTVDDIPAELRAKPRAAAETVSKPVGAGVLETKAVDWHRLAATAFFCGAGACCGWLAMGHLLLWRLLRGSDGAPAWVAHMIDTRMPHGLRRPRVRVCRRLSRPVTCGAWRPVILLPESLLRDERESQLRQVLAHELGHVRQRDGWGSALFCAALPVLYFHPLYWWLRRCAELSRELVVDDWAARVDGKEAYVAELVALARSRMGRMVGPVGAVGILQVRSHFYRRMRMLLERHRPLATRCSTPCRTAMGTVVLGMVIGMSATLGVRPARAEEKLPTGVATLRTVSGDAAPAPAAHVIGPGDLLNISVNDVAGPGVETVKSVRVPDDGLITLPLIGRVLAAGMTEDELTKSIAQWYRDKNLIPNAPVSVAVVETAPRGAGRGAGAGAGDAVADIDTGRKTGAAGRIRRAATGDGIPGGGGPSGAARAGDGPAAPAPARAVGGVQLDLVSLANTMVDAAGALQLAKVNYEHMAAAAKSASVSHLELETARAHLDIAEKRLNLLRGIAKVALQGAQDEMSRAKAMYERGMSDAQVMSEATSKVKMLELIIAGGQ